MARIETALLIIAFNRPGELKKVINALSSHTYRKIYAFVDGPREGVETDIAKVEECKALLTGIGFCDEVVTLFNSKNLGCGKGPFTAISRAFELEEELIILEDDCVPAKSFPQYCEELLKRYREEGKVWMVGGSNFSEECYRGKEDYTFSEYSHHGGWASWRRSWKNVEFEPIKCLYLLPEFIGSDFRTPRERKFFGKILEANLRKKEVSYWDYQASLACALTGGLNIVPRKNLICNVGTVGTHFSGSERYLNLPVPDEFEIFSHPLKVTADTVFDTCHFKKHIVRVHQRPLFKRIKNRLRKMISLKN